MKIRIRDLENFRQAADFLAKSERAITDCFDDPVFLREFRNSLRSVRHLADAIGQSEITIRG